MEALSPHDAWMCRCLTLAREAHERGAAPIGCVIVRGGQVVAAASE